MIVPIFGTTSEKTDVWISAYPVNKGETQEYYIVSDITEDKLTSLVLDGYVPLHYAIEHIRTEAKSITVFHPQGTKIDGEKAVELYIFGWLK